MKPSIGRIVHFYDVQGGIPAAALITQVHSDACVNLTVFYDQGVPTTETSVEFVEAGSDLGGRSSAWTWPPRV